MYYFILFALCTLVLTQNDENDMKILKRPTSMVTLKIPINSPQQICTLEDMGVTIHQSLNFNGSSYFEHPCVATPSKISFVMHSELDIINVYSSEKFKQSLEDGHFTEKIDSIIKFVHIDQGVLILTNQPSIIIIKIEADTFDYKVVYNETIKDEKILQIFSKCSDSMNNFIQYHQNTQTVYVLSCNQFVSFKIQDDQVSQFKIYEIQINNSVQMFHISRNLAYIAFKNYMTLYSLDNNMITKLFDIDYDVTDLKIVHKIDNSSEDLYILDRNIGVLFYKLDYDLLALYPNQNILQQRSISTIPLKEGVSLDLYENTLMVLNPFHAIDFHLTNDSWIQLSTWIVDSPVHNVEVTNQFAIVSGNNGHYIFYHSINRNYFKAISDNQFETQPFFMRGVREVDFYAKDLYAEQVQYPDYHQNIIFGVSNYRFIIAQWDLKPFTINCYSQNTQNKPIYLDAKVITTQCPEKLNKDDDLLACEQDLQYKIYFLQPIFTTKHYKIFITILAVFTFILFSALVVVIKKYQEYQLIMSPYTSVPVKNSPTEHQQIELPSYINVKHSKTTTIGHSPKISYDVEEVTSNELKQNL